MDFLNEGFVKQDADLSSLLSPEALAALKGLAISKGIGTNQKQSAWGDSDNSNSDNDDVNDNNEEEEVDINSLMSSVRGHFEMEKIGSKEHVTEHTYGDVTFSVRGVKPELGRTLESTGLCIWRAAENLCTWIVEGDNAANFKGKTVCELGAGLGLVSILLAKMRDTEATMPPIVCTDGDEVSIKLLKENIERNACEHSIVAEKLYWGQGHEEFIAQHPDIDVIVAADVIYEGYHLEAVLSTVEAIFAAREQQQQQDDGEGDLGREGVKFYLSYARRHVSLDAVLEAFAAAGFESEAVCGDVEPVLLITRARK
jgi:predicted nicotinamide N-methyase